MKGMKWGKLAYRQLKLRIRVPSEQTTSNSAEVPAKESQKIIKSRVTALFVSVD